jgi:hypothetical protein
VISFYTWRIMFVLFVPTAYMTEERAFPLRYELIEGSGMAEPSRDHLVQLLLFVYNHRFLIPEAGSEQRRRATRARG